MLEERFEEEVNESKVFSIAVVALLVLLMGASLVIWRTQSARSTALKSADPNGYEYTASQAGGGSGSCGGCGGGSAAASSGNCCGGSGSGAAQTPGEDTGDLLKKAEKAGLEYYKERNEDASVTAKATDYGCHLQVDILKGDKVVKSLGYDAATGIYEID